VVMGDSFPDEGDADWKTVLVLIGEIGADWC
jgi:hypothetical protein